jgi:hypothetical protein
MKQTARAKDIPDRLYLRELVRAQGIQIEPDEPKTPTAPGSTGSWLGGDGAVHRTATGSAVAEGDKLAPGRRRKCDGSRGGFQGGEGRRPGQFKFQFARFTRVAGLPTRLPAALALSQHVGVSPTKKAQSSGRILREDQPIDCAFDWQAHASCLRKPPAVCAGLY